MIVKVSQAILGNYLLPFFIGLLAVILLRETITPLMLAGGGIILVATLMVTVYESGIQGWLVQAKGRWFNDEVT